MTRFSDLSIQGYRRLHDVQLPLRPLSVMIGANGTGKTSVLDVLSLFIFFRFLYLIHSSSFYFIFLFQSLLDIQAVIPFRSSILVTYLYTVS